MTREGGNAPLPGAASVDGNVRGGTGAGTGPGAGDPGAVAARSASNGAGRRRGRAPRVNPRLEGEFSGQSFSRGGRFSGRGGLKLRSKLNKLDKLNEAGRYREGRAAAEKALKQNPADATAMLELAVAQASQAIEIYPNGAQAYAVRAAAYLELKLYEESLQDLRSAALRDPQYMAVLRKIGGDEAVPKGMRWGQIRFAVLKGDPFVLGGIAIAVLGLVVGLLIGLKWVLSLRASRAVKSAAPAA